MKPRHHGNILTFERMAREQITTDSTDKAKPMEMIKFFWLVKGMMERSIVAIERLRESNDRNMLLDCTSDDTRQLLPDLLKPRPIKPVKGPESKGVMSLDPVTIIF
ncbi:hypothetical protein [Absidia glauca]|uniref:Uncharacterized protein n=1 Tax=Absidia glauca TaxID=4829 RepID=A0A168P7I6_ABSGL|nr:hypothetical protein [Absidia glauca]